MAARFPILSLTPEIFEKIAVHLEIPDLFELAQCSKKSYDLVKSTMQLVENTMSLDITLLEDKSHVRIYLELTEQLFWILYGKRNSMRFDHLDGLEPRTISGISDSKKPKKPIVFYRKNRKEYGIVCCGIEETLNIAQYLSDLFDLPVDNLSFQRNESEYLDTILSYEMIKRSNMKVLEFGRRAFSYLELLRIRSGRFWME